LRCLNAAVERFVALAFLNAGGQSIPYFSDCIENGLFISGKILFLPCGLHADVVSYSSPVEYRPGNFWPEAVGFVRSFEEAARNMGRDVMERIGEGVQEQRYMEDKRKVNEKMDEEARKTKKKGQQAILRDTFEELAKMGTSTSRSTGQKYPSAASTASSSTSGWISSSKRVPRIRPGMDTCEKAEGLWGPQRLEPDVHALVAAADVRIIN